MEQRNLNNQCSFQQYVGKFWQFVTGRVAGYSLAVAIHNVLVAYC